MGLTQPKGVLLYGPPGCAKTTLVTSCLPVSMVPSKLSPKARDDTSNGRLGRSHSGGSERQGTGSQTVLEKPPPLPQSSQSCCTSQGNALSWPPSNTHGMGRWTRCVALSGLLSLSEPQSLALDAGPCAEMQGGQAPGRPPFPVD